MQSRRPDTGSEETVNNKPDTKGTANRIRTTWYKDLKALPKMLFSIVEAEACGWWNDTDAFFPVAMDELQEPVRQIIILETRSAIEQETIAQAHAARPGRMPSKLLS